MPWWGWVLIGFGAAVAVFTWALARTAALADRRAEEMYRAYVERDRDVTQWSQERWNAEATRIVGRLKADAPSLPEDESWFFTSRFRPEQD